MPPLKPYCAELSYSYAPGLFPSMELMRSAPERARRLLISEKASGAGVIKLREICRDHGVREEVADRALRFISGKSNCFAAVVFDKWQSRLSPEAPHVLLHNPMDEGNLGTVMRTLLGFGIRDMAIVRPAADAFDPKVARASMGALFSQNVCYFNSFEDYIAGFSGREIYPFMLEGSIALREAASAAKAPYTLVFGNEGAGLPKRFAAIGKPVRIPHSGDIDSLNLAIAVAIGAYEFTGRDGNV